MPNNQLHTHFRQSAFDGCCEYAEAVKHLKEIGGNAIAITDHGVLTGVFPFVQACNDGGVKPLVGVEAYVQEDDEFSLKCHQILYAKDKLGFVKGINKAVTKSNKRIDSKDAPRMNREILTQCFGPGSPAHGHVVTTTACMQGVCNSIILSNQKTEAKIEKIQAKRDKHLYPGDEAYEKKAKEMDNIVEKITKLREEKDTAAKIAKKPVKKLESAMKAAEGTSDYEARKKVYEDTLAEIEAAAVRKKELESEIATASKKKTELNQEIKKLQESMDKWIELDDEMQALSSNMMSDEDMEAAVKEELAYLVETFGEGNVFAEVQYHGIEAEAKCMPILARIAHECNIPLVAANDAHMVYGTEEERRKRQILRSLRYNKWEDEFPGDAELYFKTDEQLREMLEKILSKEDVDEAITNVDKVVELCNYLPEKEDHYPKFKSDIAGEDANTAIRRIANENIEWRFPGKKGWTKEYEDRLEYELGIICKMGYADYHLIVQDFLNFGRRLGHLTDDELAYVTEHISKMSLSELNDYVNSHQDEVGLTIGPGRGSAVGSLVCYLLGITSIDPIKYDLLFERFLNPERISMPDIDSDFASEIRDLVIEYVKKLYGENAVTCIMTRGTQACKGSVRNCARLRGSELYDDTTAFLALGDMISKKIPSKPGTSFSSIMDIYDTRVGKHYESLDDYNDDVLKNASGRELCEKIENLPSEVQVTRLYELLVKEFADNENALKILEDAKLVEGTFTHYGSHAAGVIISDNADVSDYVALMWDDKKKIWKTQCDMIEAEDQGLLKMDFLGLNNLSIITKALRYIRQRHGKSIDPEKLEIDPAVLANIYAAGKTNNVFQFESGGMKQMLKRFGPTSIFDILLLNAAYRPGPMQYLDGIVDVKNGRKPIEYLIPELKPILSNTYGAIIYQEQVMRIFQDLGGYTLGGADLVRRFMSKKKYAKLAHERESFIKGDPERNIKGCEANGIDAEKANQLFDQMMDFAAYAFNKSHACAYAMVSYYTAWLKYYYPLEYFCAVLNSIELEKIPSVMEDCKYFNITVLPPNINESLNQFVIVDDKIVFGLGSVKNVGDSAIPLIAERTTNGKFTSLKDFAKRGHVKKDATEALIKAGALDLFNNNREALLRAFPSLIEHMQKMTDKTAVIEAKTAELEALKAEFEAGKVTEKDYSKREKTLLRSINTAQAAATVAQEALDEWKIPVIIEDTKTRLANEKEMLGVYVSSHPLDEYVKGANMKGVTSISDIVTGKKDTTIMGIIKGLNIRQRKKDGANMAFFQLEDKTGEIEVCCFTKAFEEFGELIHEDEVVKLVGTCNEEAGFNDDETVVRKFYVSKVLTVKPYRSDIILHVKDIEEYTEKCNDIIEYYATTDGHNLLIHIDNTSRLVPFQYQVTDAILHNNLGLTASIKE